MPCEQMEGLGVGGGVLVSIDIGGLAEKINLECQFNRNILLTLRFPKIIIYVSWFVNEDYRIGVVIATNVIARLI